jgi:hypothetical protein
MVLIMETLMQKSRPTPRKVEAALGGVAPGSGERGQPYTLLSHRGKEEVANDGIRRTGLARPSRRPLVTL